MNKVRKKKERKKEMTLIEGLIVVPIIGGVWIMLTSKGEEAFKKGMFVSLLTFVGSLEMWVRFDKGTEEFKEVVTREWIPGWYVTMGVDGISMCFILLTTILVPISLMGSGGSIKKDFGLYYGSFLVMEGIIIGVFGVLDLLVFYIMFETVLIPMYIMIGVWGSRERRVRAGYFFFLYTLFGSVFMLLAIMCIYMETGTTDYQMLLEMGINEKKQKILWLGVFVAFAVKVPMVPVHIWLPEAHVEAPTGGSVILAGVLLKLGGYGMIRYSIPLFPEASEYFTPMVYVISIIGVIYTSMTAMRQTDMKRIIAYASVAHMNMILVGMFSQTPQGVEGAVLQMLSHGIVAGGMFMCVGVLYDRYHTRMVKYYSGMAHIMPMYCTIFLVFTMANIAIPGTSSFVGEYMIIQGTFEVNSFAAFMVGTSMVLGGGYSLYLYNRIAYGNYKMVMYEHELKQQDLTRKEYNSIIPLVVLIIIMGIAPEIFLEVLRQRPIW